MIIRIIQSSLRLCFTEKNEENVKKEAQKEMKKILSSLKL